MSIPFQKCCCSGNGPATPTCVSPWTSHSTGVGADTGSWSTPVAGTPYCETNPSTSGLIYNTWIISRATGGKCQAVYYKLGASCSGGGSCSTGDAPPDVPSATKCPLATATTGCDATACVDGCTVFSYHRASDGTITGPSSFSGACNFATGYTGHVSECDTGWQAISDEGPGAYERFIVKCLGSTAPATPSYP